MDTLKNYRPPFGYKLEPLKSLEGRLSTQVDKLFYLVQANLVPLKVFPDFEYDVTYQKYQLALDRQIYELAKNSPLGSLVSEAPPRSWSEEAKNRQEAINALIKAFKPELN